ncbi:hypothetical protein BJV78DRAFT_1208537 [Lactifluus subvellereus]|nr:hypothetical protein BJV78DRAFT_1208537 [Lactifluus subvellereus]
MSLISTVQMITQDLVIERAWCTGFWSVRKGTLIWRLLSSFVLYFARLMLPIPWLPSSLHLC